MYVWRYNILARAVNTINTANCYISLSHPTIKHQHSEVTKPRPPLVLAKYSIHVFTVSNNLLRVTAWLCSIIRKLARGIFSLRVKCIAKPHPVWQTECSMIFLICDFCGAFEAKCHWPAACLQAGSLVQADWFSHACVQVQVSHCCVVDISVWVSIATSGPTYLVVPRTAFLFSNLDAFWLPFVPYGLLLTPLVCFAQFGHHRPLCPHPTFPPFI